MAAHIVWQDKQASYSYGLAASNEEPNWGQAMLDQTRLVHNLRPLRQALESNGTLLRALLEWPKDRDREHSSGSSKISANVRLVKAKLSRLVRYETVARCCLCLRDASFACRANNERKLHSEEIKADARGANLS